MKAVKKDSAISIFDSIFIFVFLAVYCLFPACLLLFRISSGIIFSFMWCRCSPFECLWDENRKQLAFSSFAQTLRKSRGMKSCKHSQKWATRSKQRSAFSLAISHTQVKVNLMGSRQRRPWLNGCQKTGVRQFFCDKLGPRKCVGGC